MSKVRPPQYRVKLSERDPRARWPTQITSRPFLHVAIELGLPTSTYAYRGKRIVVVGEGFSNFAKTLEGAGAKVFAVDPIYALGKEELRQLWISGGYEGADFAEFVSDVGTLDPEDIREMTLTPEEALRRRAQRAVAAEVTALPFRSATADLVCCNHLIEYLAKQDAVRGIQEMLRLVRPGGAVHLNLFRFMQEELEPIIKRRNPSLVIANNPPVNDPMMTAWILTKPVSAPGGTDDYVAPT
ncbi:MAG: methyltransferase domain-containing protein [Myxococcaceae bacterium]